MAEASMTDLRQLLQCWEQVLRWLQTLGLGKLKALVLQARWETAPGR